MISKNHFVYPALSIAKYLVWKASNNNKGITNKKLQKLVYYSQAWNLALYDEPLFKEQIQAWIHGPTVPIVYRKYKKYGFNLIKEDAKDCDIFSFNFDQRTIGLLNEVYDVYGKYDADYLEILTHSEEPWQNAREGLNYNEFSKAIISHEDMKNYYRKLKKK